MAEINIIDVEYGTKDILHAELGALPEPYAALVVAKPETCSNVVRSLLEILLNERKRQCLYITANKPFSKILLELKARKVDTAKLRFIDCVSRHAAQHEATVFVAPLAAELSEKIASELGKKQVVFIDSLSSLLLYNDEKTLQQFVSEVIEAAARNSSSLLCIAVESRQVRSFLDSIAAMFDKTIRVTK